MNGKMTGGFAILATPVKYGETGIMSFMIGRQGFVSTETLDQTRPRPRPPFQLYNPGDNWSPIDFKLRPAGRKRETQFFMRFPFCIFSWAQPEVGCSANA